MPSADEATFNQLLGLSVIRAVQIVLGVPVAEILKLGASFTAATDAVTCTAVAENVVPSPAFTIKALSKPLLWADGVQTKLSPTASIVVPATTATPPLVRAPEVTDSIRKLITSFSTSVAFDAANKAA